MATLVDLYVDARQDWLDREPTVANPVLKRAMWSEWLDEGDELGFGHDGAAGYRTWLTKVAATPDLVKVGPKGYEHGWIFVGIPGKGDRVHHPLHGHGTVARTGKATVTVHFDSGHKAAFEHGESGKPGEHFVKRVPKPRKPRDAARMGPGRGSVPRPAKLSPEEHSRQIMQALMAGQKTTIKPSEVGGLLDAITVHSPQPFNLNHLSVSGPGNGNLFSRHLRDIPRDQMPALPDTVGGLTDFMTELNHEGVSLRLESVDPRKLVATQSQLSGPKVAKLANLMREHGWKKGGALIVSREGALLDGHHRWAGAAAASASGSKIRATVLRVDMPIDDLLQFAERFSGPKKALTEAP